MTGNAPRSFSFYGWSFPDGKTSKGGTGCKTALCFYDHNGKNVVINLYKRYILW